MSRGPEWTPEQSMAFRRDYLAGVPVPEIARALNRTRSALYVRAYQLGLNRPPRPSQLLSGIYTDQTMDRLVWQYGDERLDSILDGKDVRTELDLMAWKALRNRRAAA